MSGENIIQVIKLAIGIAVLLWITRRVFGSLNLIPTPPFLKPHGEVDDTDDSPVAFGYKGKWLAIKSSDQDLIVKKLGLTQLKDANWRTGIKNAYEGSIFVSPAIDGWTLVVGYQLPDEDNLQVGFSLMNDLSSQFSEVQYFCTHRIVEYHSWVKSLEGQVERAYSYLGESGENLIVFGEPTEVEKGLDLVNTLSKEAQSEDYFDQDGLTYPDEELVMKIAESWSINPTTLDERTNVKGLGVLGRIY